MNKALLGIALIAAAGLALSVGCADNRESKKASTTQPISRYKPQGPRPVPDYLKGTIYEKANIDDLEPFLVNSYGLVGGLRGTGDNSAVSTAVREYIRKEIMRHGFGTYRNPVSPETVLRDSTYAIVRVDALIPPGCRKDDRIDVLVSVPEESYTSSLSHGTLYQTPLKYMGAFPQAPGGLVNSQVTAQGSVFVNPDYALVNAKKMDAAARRSSRYGVIMGGGMNLYDSPLVVRVRDPQYATARAIEQRVNQRFQGVCDKTNQKGLPGMAQAEDDGIVHVFVPHIYRGDYEHFAGVVKHLYMDSSPGFLAAMAEKLAVAADQPKAPLENISYAWEGIGEPATPVLTRMMKSPKPEVAYAAARASAFTSDDVDEARHVLVAMAKDPANPFRLNAVKTLSDMPSSPETRPYLRQLLNVEDAQVRIQAYLALVRGDDPRVYSQAVHDKFFLDLVPSSASPMIYCTRRGTPRIAIFGTHQWLQTPVTFSAMDTRLTLTADRSGGDVTLFYRSDQTMGDRVTTPIRQKSRADLADIVSRLAGEAAEGEQPLDFSYADVVSIVQSMHREGKLQAQTLEGATVPVTLIIEEQTGVSEDAVNNAPKIPEAGREQHDNEDTVAPVIPDREQPAAPNSGAKKAPANNSRPN